MAERSSYSDIWENMLERSPQARYEGDHTLTGFAPFLLVACAGGTVADALISSVRKRWQQPWVAVVVLFGVGWAMMRFVQREGVRILVAGMYGRIGPASYEMILKPLYAKLTGDGKPLPDAAQPKAEKADKADKKAGPAGNAANCANDPFLLAEGAANEEMWQPPDMEQDIRPLAQAMSANRQMLCDMSGEIFNEMQRRQMVDPGTAHQTAEEFQKVLQDVFAKMAQ